MAANFDLAEAWFRNDRIVSPPKMQPITVTACHSNDRHWRYIDSSVSRWIGWTCSLSSCIWCLLMHWMSDSASLLKTSPSTSGCRWGHVVLPATPFSSTLHWATYRMLQSGNQQKLLVLQKRGLKRGLESTVLHLIKKTRALHTIHSNITRV